MNEIGPHQKVRPDSLNVEIRSNLYANTNLKNISEYTCLL